MGLSGRQGRIGDWRVEIAMPHTCHVLSGVLNLDAGIQCLCDSDYDRTNTKAGDADTLHTTNIKKINKTLPLTAPASAGAVTGHEFLW
jgi:hypothetical protein